MADNTSKLPEILAREVVAESRLLKIESLHLKFSNGEERQYERVKGRGYGAVMIVPITAQGSILLVREYAAGTHDYQLGFPKGLIDKGETAEQAANRELQEEVGFGAKQFTALKKLAMAPAFFNSQMSIFIAQELYPNQLEGDEPEPLELVEWPVEKLVELLVQEDFTEARSVAALLMLQNWLRSTGE